MTGYKNGFTGSASRVKKARGAGKSQQAGKQFEQIIRIPAMRESVCVVQIPSSARWVGPKIVPMKSPFDFVMCREGVAVFFDAKSTGGKTFSASKVTPHQLIHLTNLGRSGVRAGYVVFFSELDVIVFYTCEQLASLMRGKSLKPQDGLQLGSSLTLSLLPLFF